MGQGEERCSHGCTMPPPDHAVSRFMNTFRDTLDKRIMEAMRCIFEAHPNVCNSDEHRQMAIGILLSVGTNIILHRATEDHYKVARRIGMTILYVEYYKGKGEFMDTTFHVATIKGTRSLPLGSSERDVLKFYSKRLTCLCLKEKYKQARKDLPKIGKCYRCANNVWNGNL